MDKREERHVDSERGSRQIPPNRRNMSENSRHTASQRPNGSSGRRPPGSKKRYSRARRRRNAILRIFLLLIVLVIAAGLFIFWLRYGSSNEKADLKAYYGLQSDDELAVVINNRVIKNLDTGTGGRIFGDEYYLEYSVIRQYINERFYWDSNENVLLYTLPDGNVSVEVGGKDYMDITTKRSENYVILKTEGKTAYVALPFVQKFSNMEYSIHQNPNRVVITSEWGEKTTAVLRRNTPARYQAGVKSPILTEIARSDKVIVLESEGDWRKVATSDGFIGYVKNSALKKETKEVISRDFEEPVFKNISRDYTINMAWHNVSSADANNYILERIASTKGLTEIAPTWLSLADTNGNITSLASPEYVNYVHQSNIEVWATLRDFHGGIDSFDETYQVLSYTSKRESVINQTIAEALRCGIDGINLDFELISLECGVHYVQFVRELSVKCRQNGLVFSVNNYVPQPYNEHYNLEEQGIVADYVIIMGYDEHTEGSMEAGPVASYEYVKGGIEAALKMVPEGKLINAIPFYSRLWFETPKSEQELSEQAGTDDANYKYNVSSTALGMDEVQTVLADAGVQAEWDDTTRMNFAQWDADGGTYKVWVEDGASIEEKLKLMKTYNLAGVAAWRLGLENSAIWDLILQYVN